MVSEVAERLQHQNLIKYQQGRMTISCRPVYSAERRPEFNVLGKPFTVEKLARQMCSGYPPRRH